MSPHDIAVSLVARIRTINHATPALVRLVGNESDRRLAIVTWRRRLRDGPVLLAEAEVDGIPLTNRVAFGLRATVGHAVSGDGASELTLTFLQLDDVRRVRSLGREVPWRHAWVRDFEVRDGRLVERWFGTTTAVSSTRDLR